MPGQISQVLKLFLSRSQDLLPRDETRFHENNHVSKLPSLHVKDGIRRQDIGLFSGGFLGCCSSVIGP